MKKFSKEEEEKKKTVVKLLPEIVPPLNDSE